MEKSANIRNTNSYIKDHPRPQLSRSDWQNLNGVWDFAFDDSLDGEGLGYHKEFKPDHSITVPFTYETKMSGIGDESIHPCVWYSRKLDIPADKLGGRVMLHFEGVDYIADVWVNGIHIGSHKGGYARFSVDATNSVKTGENTVTVRACDYLTEAQPRGKQRWIKDNFGCWYVQTTGIWKTVWVEFLPETYIKAVKMTPDMASHSIDIEAEISNPFGDYQMGADITFDGKPVAHSTFQVVNGRAKTSICVFNTAIHEWGVCSWSPEEPNLYDVKFTLISDSIEVDTALSYFGMREISIMNREIILNRNKLYQRLILDQGYWKDSHLTPPSEEALIEDIDKIFALGYNGLRKHQKIEDERFLYWCDVKGMLVWSEMAAAYSYSDTAVEDFTNQWMEIVRQNYNHPCIITWTPINESWGVPAVLRNKQQQHFTEAIYHLTKSFDKMRPVIVNDGWEQTISDIITLHDYQESGDMFFEKYSNYIDDILNNRMPHSTHQFAFAEGYEYKGQPIIISEYGGIAFNDESGWGYGNQVSSKEDFIKRFDSITTAIKKLPFICGFCYTQVTDVQQEVNGLMDIDRGFKIDPDVIKEINTRNVIY